MAEKVRPNALPPIDELVDPDIHLGACRRRAIASRVEAGDIRRTLHGRGAHADDPVVAARLAPLADGPGGADDGVGAGLVGQVSLRAMVPLVLVITRFCGASAGNSGCAGGATTWSWPNWARAQLILMNTGSR